MNAGTSSGSEASAASEPPSWRAQLEALPVWGQLAAVLLTVYVVGVSVMRFSQCLVPWVAETDWKQWVWPYWRYSLPGAFPEGHVVTDYTFNAQPPLYHAAMSTLSRVVEPVVAANVVNWVAWALALFAIVWAVARRSHVVVGLAAAAFFVHDDVLHKITMGGYPRSFGPTLTLLFVAAWLNGRHRLVLLVLVCGAALYPSVCVPCGLAYGLWTFAATPRTSLRAWLRKNVEVALTGVAVGVLGMWQSLTAPGWWGSVVKAADAVGLGADGRSQWLPLGPFWPQVASFASEPYVPNGAHYAGVSEGVVDVYAAVAAVVVAVVGVVVARRRGRPALLVPVPLLLTLACAVIAFFLAREFAFRLYLPRRMIQHTLPGLVVLSLTLLYFNAGVALLGDRLRAVAFVLVAMLLPLFALSGDGLGPSRYRSYAKDAPLYTWVQEHTKVDDQFGGYYRVLDEIPFFAARQVYINWKMAHPFRLGYFEEVEKRTLQMYDAYFCTDLRELLRFMSERDVDYFIVRDMAAPPLSTNAGSFDALEGGDSQLFEPMRQKILDQFFQPRIGRFALRAPPAEIVVFAHGANKVISRERLAAHLAAQPMSTSTTP